MVDSTVMVLLVKAHCSVRYLDRAPGVGSVKWQAEYRSESDVMGNPPTVNMVDSRSIRAVTIVWLWESQSKIRFCMRGQDA